MNFLQIVQRTREKCGIPGVGPTSVVGQSGELLRLVHWVAEAWVDIQLSLSDNGRLLSDFSFTTTPGQDSYTPAQAGITDFSNWEMESIRCNTGAGQFRLKSLDYAYFRDQFQLGAVVQGLPLAATFHPSTKSLVLGPSPSGAVVISGQYQRTAVELALDADEPALDEQYQMLIVYEAMKRYAGYENAPEVMTTAVQGVKPIIQRLIQRSIQFAHNPGFGV